MTEIAAHVKQMHLSEWCYEVTVSTMDAKHLQRAIEGQGFILNEEQLHESFDWFIIADFSGVHPEWPGYKR